MGGEDPYVSHRAMLASAQPGMQPKRVGPRLDLHPDDLLGNEAARQLCAHYLGQDTPVTRATLAKWRRSSGFPAPLPCARAGVELWDARQVRAWVQEWARNPARKYLARGKAHSDSDATGT